MTAARLLPTADAAGTRRALLARLRPARGRLTASGLLFVVRALAGLVLPLALGRVVDVVVDGRGAAAVTGPVVAILVAGLVEAVASMAGTAMAARATLPPLADLREDVVERALGVPLETVEHAGVGDLVARVDGDVGAVNTAVLEAFPLVLESALAIGLTVVGLAALDWRLALAGLCAAPIQAHTLRWYLPRSNPLYAAERISVGRRSEQVLESVGGAETVRALVADEQHLALVRDRSGQARDLSLSATWLRTRFFARLNLAEAVGLTAVLVVGFLLQRSGNVSVGAVTAAALLFQRLFDPINTLLYLVDEAQSAGAALARLVGVAAMDGPEPTPSATRHGNAVELRGVHFAYEGGADVLRGVDLQVEANEVVALVGTSGAGKSTVARLVAGLLSPDVGTVGIGGAPPDAADPAGDLPVALVTQEVHLFAGTLADDLRLARPDATDAELLAALGAVGSDVWFDSLGDGLATEVGEGALEPDATTLQMLALARVLLADPAVVVLDEATAEAGSAGARRLEQASAAVTRGRTALVVAHRLSQAAAADRVVVMEAGRVVESGTHTDLVAAGGAYATLWRAWHTH